MSASPIEPRVSPEPSPPGAVDTVHSSRVASQATRWIGLAVFIAMWLAIAAYLFMSRHQAAAQADAELEQTAQVVADLVDRHFNRTAKSLLETSRWIDERGFDLARPKPADVDAMRSHIETQLAQLAPTSLLAVLAPNGELIVSAPSVDIRLNRAELALERRALSEGTTPMKVGRAIPSRLFDGVFVPLAMRAGPVLASGQSGMVLGGVEISQITHIAAQFAVQGGKQIVLFNQSGQLLSNHGAVASPAQVDKLFQQAGTGLVQHGQMALGNDNLSFVIQRVGVAGVASILVIVVEDSTRLMASYHQDKWEAVAFGSIVSLLLTWFSFVLSRQFEQREATERELAARERVLADKHAELVAAQKLAKLGSWTTDAQHRMLSPSEEYLRIYGVTASDCPRTTEEWLARFTDEKQREDARVNLEKIRQGLPYEGTRLVRLKDGREKWVNFKAIPIKSAEGVFLGHRGVVRDVTQEKRAEQMLAAKTTELETAKRIAGLGVWYWDVLTDAIQVDAKMREIYGVDENDMPTKLLDWGLRFYTKADIDLHRAEYDRRFDGMPINNTRAIQRARGEIRWVHTLGSPVLDRHGALIGYRGITRDITSEKEAERRLAESEERYRLISENMRDIVAVHDPDGTIVYASPSLTRTLGYSVEKTFGKKPFAFIHPEDLEHVKQAVRDVVDGRSEASSVWYRFRHLDGHECWMESVIVPVRHPDGLIRQYQTATREISQRKQAERALRASEERFRSLTELSSDWYWELDAQFRFSFISRDKAKRTRRTREDLMGRTRWDVFPTAMTPEEWAAHRADLEAHRPFFNLVMRVVDPDTDETRGYSSLNGEPVFDENGKFTGYRGTGQDITERKLAEAALAKRTRELALTNKRLEEEAQQRKQLERNFLMAIEMELAQVGLELHDDLGQDLTGVALLTKTLEKKLAEQGMAESADAARISELTNRAIKHTRMISHGLSPYIWGSAGLISALTQMANDISVLGVVECEVDIDKKIEIEDEVVARNLYRITQESVNNALKHSRARRIGISLTQTGKNISLTIADDGIGRSDVPAPDDAESKFHSIRHRANSINAKLSVRRGRRGGTVVKVHCQSALEYYLPPHTEEMS